MTPITPRARHRRDDLAAPLRDVAFCVVDLETTGGSPTTSRVTELGAVKIRAGEVVGELATLVDPGLPIPASISVLTGITQAMVAGRPPLEAVLPTFLEFSRGTTLVAHNARFDTGFLNAGLRRLDYPRLDHPVVCTASLARRLVRDEVRDCRLATLARFFRTRTEPTHRALTDARATVEVFHALLERAGSFGVTTLDDLLLFTTVRNTPLFKARRSLLEHLPSVPGVYLFRSASGEVLYVGKATDLRARVRGYFSSDNRRKVVDLLKEAATVDHVACPTPVEAAVRELRLIHEHRPRFNQRGKPRRPVHLVLTDETFPRLSIARRPPDDGRAGLGPIASHSSAQQIVDALHDAVPIRRCTDRIGVRTRFPACALAEMGRCRAPCEGRIDQAVYASIAAPAVAALSGDPTVVLRRLRERMEAVASTGRFEEAATLRDRITAVVHASLRARRTAWLGSARLLSAAGRRSGGYDVIVVRDGALVGSARCCRNDEVDGAVGRLLAQPTLPDSGTAGDPDERDLLARWLERQDVRVLRCEGTVASPTAGGALLAEVAGDLATARRSTERPRAELAAKRVRRDP